MYQIINIKVFYFSTFNQSCIKDIHLECVLQHMLVYYQTPISDRSVFLKYVTSLIVWIIFKVGWK